MNIIFVQDELYLGTILKCPQADHVRCCGVSVSSVVGTTTNDSPNRISKDFDEPETTDANYEISTEAEMASTTPIELNETNGFTTENFVSDIFTTESSTEVTTENENAITTTEIANEIVHRDGEIIDNVMLFYPSEMSGKPKAKPDDMPSDTNEFRIHDDAMDTDLHLIFPVNGTKIDEAVAIVKAQTTKAIETTTQFLESKTVTTTDAPKEALVLVTPSHERSVPNIPSTETPASPAAEATIDLKSEGSELANQIENVTVKRPRYRRRKFKLKYMTKPPTTTTSAAPTAATTPIAVYRFRSSNRNSSSADLDDESSVTSIPLNIVDVAETSTRRAYSNHLKSLFKPRIQSTVGGTQPSNISNTGVANEHELKINALHSTLTETMDVASPLNVTNFLIQRRQSEHLLNARRKIFNAQRAIRPNISSITPTTTTLATFTDAEADVATTETPTEIPHELKTTTAKSFASGPVISLRERFSRRRIPGINRNRNPISIATTSTTSTTEATTTKTAEVTTTTTEIPKIIESQTKGGVRGIWRRRRPIARPKPIDSNLLDSIEIRNSIAENVSNRQNVQKIRMRTKVDRMSSSKLKLMENIRRKRPTTTTESSVADPLMEMLQRKRSTTKSTEAPVRSNPTRRYRRRRTSTIATTTTTEPTTVSASMPWAEEDQSIDTFPDAIEPIEITTIRTTRRPTTTTTISIPTTPFEVTKQPNFDKYTLEANTTPNDEVVHHLASSPKDYTTIKRPYVPFVEQPQSIEFNTPNSQLTKTETFPDMRLPNEANKPFRREPIVTRIAQWPVTAPPMLQVNPSNHLGLSSVHSEQLHRPLRTPLPTNRRLEHFLPPSVAPFHSGTGISPLQSTAPVPHRYYIHQNDPFQRIPNTGFNAAQLQQRPVSYISRASPYAGHTAPSPFGNLNFPFNFN